MELKGKLRNYAIENAIKFGGKANPGAVIGKALSEDNDLKKDMASLSRLANEIVKEVNSADIEELKKEFGEMEKKEKPKPKEPKQRKKDLPGLPNAEIGNVVTRIPPEPSKYNHIGHALSFLINYMYAKKYNGKCIIRFEDTNPEKATQEFVDAMIEDVVNYLDVKADRIMYVSDDMPLFYGYAEKLIDMGKAYVCMCEREKMQELREKGTPCGCSEKKQADNKKEWKDMVAGKYEEGKAILRLKGDMSSDNHVMRDPVIFRINKSEHYRQKNKYFVWPMYDFENSVEDSVTGVTHILRSSEFGSMRVELQEYIKEILGLSKQTIIQYGRFNIAGATTKGREIREKIESGDVSGWDDPSLVTLKALRRRGFVKETFYELVYEVGLSASTSKNLDWTLISAINRSILDENANRYFFIDDPVEIHIEGAPEQMLGLKLHPGHPERGKRQFNVKDRFYISSDDYKKFKEGEIIRLMDCLNFVREKNRFLFHSLEHENFKDRGKLIIHWLPARKGLALTEVRMPDNTTRKGLSEDSVGSLSEGDIVQFARFGFCRLDKKEGNNLSFWFTTK